MLIVDNYTNTACLLYTRIGLCMYDAISWVWEQITKGDITANQIFADFIASTGIIVLIDVWNHMHQLWKQPPTLIITIQNNFHILI